MQPLVSLVVPVYNVEKYLAACLDSLLSQTLKELEIIAVNDGSTDNSPKILEEYQKNDSRIKVIHKKNGGLGDARNAGLSHVSGKYVMFLDSDDWLNEKALEEMVEVATKNDLDVVITPFIFEYLEGSKKFEINVQKNKVFEGEEVKGFLIRKLIGPLPHEGNSIDELNSAANKLYRVDIIKKNNLFFVSERQYYGEDLVFNLNYFKCADKVIVLDKAFYHYRKDINTSLTTRYRVNLFKMRLNLYEFLERFIEQSSNYNYKDSFEIALKGRIYFELTSNIINEFHPANNESTFRKIKEVKHMLRNPVIKNAIRNFKPNDQSIFKKMQYGVMRIGRALPLYIYCKKTIFKNL